LGRTRGTAAGNLHIRGTTPRSVFISYTTHADADLAARERLCDILGPLCRARTLGGDPWSVWVDDRCLNAGDDWNDRLTDALHGANRSLFVAKLAGGRVMSLQERQCLPRGPKEAEWEYAARAGTTTAYAFGATLSASQANSYESKIYKTVVVGSYAANGFGLSDMHGNMWEWVQDCWHDTYANAPMNGEAWETKCTEARRVLRGGSWFNLPRILRSALRNRLTPGLRFVSTGFRIARTFSL
jgi:hypothetical protein